jgi:hypothetical protein
LPSKFSRKEGIPVGVGRHCEQIRVLFGSAGAQDLPRKGDRVGRRERTDCQISIG